MDYTIEINAWNLGHDEADELIDAICDVLAERGLGCDDSDPEGEVRSIVALKPRGVTGIDAGDRRKARKVLRDLTRGARLVAIPGTDYRKARS